MAEAETFFVVKKVKKGGHGHHGGAWKIAYADFVTAMMAFFLLLWLISMTTPEQKKGIADYFAPPNVSDTTSGAGGVLGGTAYNDIGERMSGSATDAKTFTAPPSERKTGPMVAVRGGDTASQSQQVGTSSSSVNLKSTFDQDFHGAAASIRQAWQALPDITDIADNLVLEETRQGLNIKIKDQDGRPMFPEGSKYPYPATVKAIAALAPILEKLPNQITIQGFTASGASYSNPHYGAWELSADRANSVRQILGQYGLTDDHISAVTGRASADPLFPDDPYMAGNDRVEITVLYQAPPVPAGLAP
ncbi:MAG TPA: flagellar motor protein MotB [Devosiaceae bacterium]|jgi:chemotaxis protein MotB|nr:flagellar motor protein MotB [Devosiaceae bacterium]